MKISRKLALASALTTAATVGSVGVTNAGAAGPVVTGGLVNVTITEVVGDDVVEIANNNVSVGAALGVAADVCDVNVNVLAEQLRGGGATCTSTASGQKVDIAQI